MTPCQITQKYIKHKSSLFSLLINLSCQRVQYNHNYRSQTKVVYSQTSSKRSLVTRNRLACVHSRNASLGHLWLNRTFLIKKQIRYDEGSIKRGQKGSWLRHVNFTNKKSYLEFQREGGERVGLLKWKFMWLRWTNYAVQIDTSNPLKWVYSPQKEIIAIKNASDKPWSIPVIWRKKRDFI